VTPSMSSTLPAERWKSQNRARRVSSSLRCGAPPGSQVWLDKVLGEPGLLLLTVEKRFGLLGLPGSALLLPAVADRLGHRNDLAHSSDGGALAIAPLRGCRSRAMGIFVLHLIAQNIESSPSLTYSPREPLMRCHTMNHWATMDACERIPANDLSRILPWTASHSQRAVATPFPRRVKITARS
jgi:hypothetical protein